MAEVLRSHRPLSRAERRRIEALSDAVDRVTEADRRFFERFPDRNHRLRLMSRAERDQNTAVYAQDLFAPPPGEEWLVVVRQVESGVRLRRFVPAMVGGDLDQPEAVCKAIFDQAAGENGKAAEIEAALRSAIAKRPA